MTDAARVIATDDQAALSKVSCVRRQYWSDLALEDLIPRGPRRSPIIHAGYFCRFKVISEIFEKVLAGGFAQVVVLGAGSDTAFWRLRIGEEHPHINWFEIDFPKNLEFKSEKMEKTSHGQFANYFPVPGDLRETAIIENALVKAGIDLSAKTFLISEVVLAYLTAECSTNVIRWIASKFCECLFVEFEQINPTSTFGRVMTQHFEKIQSPIQTIEHLPTIDDRLARFKNAGFMHFGTGLKLI